MNLPTSPITKLQKDSIFMNMSDGVVLINEENQITYINPAGENIFGLQGYHFEQNDCSVEHCLIGNKSNRNFNRIIQNELKHNHKSERSLVTYHNGTEQKVLNLRISLIKRDQKPAGILILAEDVTSSHKLKKHERDCALIFAGLIICVCVYLSTWSLIKFTLGIHLKTSVYTQMIEGIAFLLFLEVILFTSLNLTDIGIFVRPSKLFKTMKSSIFIAIIVCTILVLCNVILRLSGHPVKPYFIGGSLKGAYTYIFTAILQEFLSRGVMQTSIKALMQVKYQKFFSILLTSLLFALLHLPFDFPFMTGAFIMSIALGIIYEKQENIWGCAFLHFSCGYLAMAMFF